MTNEEIREKAIFYQNQAYKTAKLINYYQEALHNFSNLNISTLESDLANRVRSQSIILPKEIAQTQLNYQTVSTLGRIFLFILISRGEG